MQLVGAAAGKRREGTSQHVIHSAERSRLFNRENVVSFFHHANNFFVAVRARAVQAWIRVGNIVADRASANFFFGVANGLGEGGGVFRGGAHRIKRQALRGFVSDARQVLQFVDKSFNRSSKIG